MKYTIKQLSEIILYNEDIKVIKKAWEIGKNKFNINLLGHICSNSDDEKIIIESWELGKDKFKDAFYLVSICYCKSNEISLKSLELGIKKDLFNNADLMRICCCPYKNVALKAFNYRSETFNEHVLNYIILHSKFCILKEMSKKKLNVFFPESVELKDLK